MGIPIRLHVSVLLLVVVFVFSHGWIDGLLFGLAFIASITLHELGHSAVALRFGCRVREITLMCFGGAAQMARIPTRPWQEFLMALAGPAVSVAIGFACVWSGARLRLPVMAGFPLPLNLVQFIGLANFVLAGFNLLPAFPMDGGRLLRALLTPRLGRLRATFIAARLGRIIAVLFGIYGFGAAQWFLVLIAFVVFISAGNEYRMVQIEEARRRAAFGFAGWEIADDDEPPDTRADDDQVVIGPPPYEDGRGSRTRIRPG